MQRKIKKIIQIYTTISTLWIGYYIVRFTQTNQEVYRQHASNLILLLGFPFILYLIGKVVARFVQSKKKRVFVFKHKHDRLEDGYQTINTEGKPVYLNESDQTFMITNIVYAYSEIHDVKYEDNALNADGSLKDVCSDMRVTIYIKHRMQTEIEIPFITRPIKTSSVFYEMYAAQAEALTQTLKSLIQEDVSKKVS